MNDLLKVLNFNSVCVSRHYRVKAPSATETKRVGFWFCFCNDYLSAVLITWIMEN